jgi:hypothetical protein
MVMGSDKCITWRAKFNKHHSEGFSNGSHHIVWLFSHGIKTFSQTCFCGKNKK